MPTKPGAHLERFDLTGRTALVTGASSGIGLHLAKVLAAAGASVALAARRVEKLEQESARLNAAGFRSCGVYLDVADSATIVPALDAAQRHFGAAPDILINNSGVVYLQRFVDQAEAEIARLFDTNLKGAFLVAQAVATRMAAAGGGSILNVASTAGLRAAGHLSSYAASKAALIHLTKVMALELASKSIRVNAICPGNMETEMHQTFTDAGIDDMIVKRIPQRRFGKMEDLDGAVLLLVSPAGSYITGAVLPIDGGQVLSWM
jgi:NAD(P)-dependent dehydrogenase (short-subunit alcohol dehydrogenase family)